MKLFIIGNGFDKAHGDNTGYDAYRKYLDYENIMIGSFPITSIFDDATENDWNDFETLLGDYNFKEWGSSYVNRIHENMGDKEEDQALSENNQRVDDYYLIDQSLPDTLKKSLCDFIRKQTECKCAKLHNVEKYLKPKDIFITFNYSYLLEDIYGIKKSNILHIRKTIDDTDIILGMEELVAFQKI